MTKKELIDATQMAGGSTPVGATISADGRVDQAALRQAEAAVAFEWQPGDVILDLYEVRAVTEGFGEDAEEKNYHEGGFGRVYKIWHRTWHREMAVKTPRAGAFATQAQKDAFTHECEIWVNLGLHSHIAACHYVRELGGVPRIFSEYADAGTLEEWIRSERLYEGDTQTALARMLDIAIQFAWGLHAAHEKGVIHQDVKPLNVLLWKDGTLKVTDFGLAVARQQAGVGANGAGGSAEMGPGVGGDGRSILVSMGGMTPAYCSPEQAAGQKLDRRTDVWSWAVSVLEMFQGEVTWQSGSLAAEALEAFIRNCGKEEGIPAMPAGVATLLRQCFQPNRADRPHTLGECAAALSDVYQANTSSPYPRAEPQAVGDTPDALNNRALSLLDLGKPEEAELLFDHALELDKHHIAATYNRELIRWRTGRCSDGSVLLSLEEIRKDHPDDASLACARGWVETDVGYYVDAVASFERAMELGAGGEARKGLEHAQRRLSGRSRQRSWRTRPVNSVAFSPDGLFILSGSEEYELSLWSVTGRESVRNFTGRPDNVYSVAFSPDGRCALVGRSKTLQLWDVATGECLRTFEGHRLAVHSATFSPDGRLALSGSSDKTIRLWDVATGDCLRSFEEPGWIYSVAYSPDGGLALSGGYDKTIRLWDLATGKCLRALEGHTDWVSSVAFSPDGRLALSGSHDTTLRLWRVATGQCLRTFQAHMEKVTSVSYSPDGRFALSGGGDETVRLWQIDTGQCRRTFGGYEASVNAVAFSPDGRFAVSGCAVAEFSTRRALQLWEVASFMERPLAPWFLSTVVTAEDTLERRRSYESHLARAREALGTGLIGSALESIRAARSVPGFERIPESLELQARAGARARVRSYGGGWLKRTFAGHEFGVESVSFSPDGHFALAAGWGLLRLWDVRTWQCLRTFEGHVLQVQSVAFGPDGRFAISGGNDRTLRLWDVATGRCVRIFKGHAEQVTSVAYSPDGRCALSGSLDRTVRLWDVETGRCLRTLEGHSAVAYSPDGRLALTGGWDHRLRLWNISTGQCLRTLEGHTEQVSSVVFSPSGRFALSGCHDATLRLWNVPTGQCLRTFEGHTDFVNSVAFSPDGRFVLSGSGFFTKNDHTLRLWEVATGECLRIFEGHTDSVNSVAFLPDGRFALSGSQDGTLRLWEIDWIYEVVRRSLAGRIANFFTGKGQKHDPAGPS